MNTMNPTQCLDWLFYELVLERDGFSRQQIEQLAAYRRRNADVWRAFDEAAYAAALVSTPASLAAVVQAVQAKLRIQLKRTIVRAFAVMVHAKYETEIFDLETELKLKEAA